jgi:hypothetical protein
MRKAVPLTDRTGQIQKQTFLWLETDSFELKKYLADAQAF